MVRPFRAVSDRATRTADIVEALDRQFADQHGALNLEVVGVHAQDGGDLWIQLCNHDATEAVVLRLRPDATATDAVSALVSMAQEGEGFPRVLDVVHRC